MGENIGPFKLVAQFRPINPEDIVLEIKPRRYLKKTKIEHDVCAVKFPKFDR